MFTREENRKIIFVDIDDTLADTRAAVALAAVCRKLLISNSSV